MRLFWAFILLLMAACVPAEQPAQLDATPGTAVILTENTYTSTAFETWYPPDWRVVSSAAFADPWVVFADAEDTALMIVAVNADDTQLQPEMPRQAEERVTLADGSMVYALLLAPDDTYLPLYRRLVESLSLPLR